MKWKLPFRVQGLGFGVCTFLITGTIGPTVLMIKLPRHQVKGAVILRTG